MEVEIDTGDSDTMSSLHGLNSSGGNNNVYSGGEMSVNNEIKAKPSSKRRNKGTAKPNTSENVKMEKSGNENSWNKNCIQVIPPYEEDSTWIMYNGYPYFLKYTSPQGSRFKCSRAECDVQLHIQDCANGVDTVDISHEHGHPPDTWVLHRNQLYQSLKRRAAAEPTAPSDVIYREEAEKFPEGAKHISYVDSVMQIWRNEKSTGTSFDTASEDEYVDDATVEWLEDLEDFSDDADGPPQDTTQRTHEISFKQETVKSDEEYADTEYLEILDDEAPPPASEAKKRKAKRTVESNRKRKIEESDTTGDEEDPSASEDCTKAEINVINTAENRKGKSKDRKMGAGHKRDLQPIAPYRRSSTWVMYKRYPFFLRERKPSGVSYKCSYKGCNVRLYVRNRTGFIDQCRRHNHAPESWIPQRNMLYQELRRRSFTELTHLKTIYKEEIVRFPEGAKHLPYLDTSMRMWRDKALADMGIEKKTKADLRTKAVGHESEIRPIAPYRIGSTYVMYRGYPYYLRNKKPAGLGYKCSNDNCKARIYVRRRTGAVDEFRQHDHPPETWVEERNMLYQALRERSFTELTHVKTIYEEEAARYPEGAKHLPFLDSSMRMWRKKAMADLGIEEKKPDLRIKASGQVNEVRPIAPYRIGSTYVMYKGYPYYLREKKSAGLGYKCTNENCCARLYIRHKTGTVDEFRQHDHPPESWVEERNEMYQEMKRRAISETTPFKEIFEEEANRFPEGAKHLSNLESSMRAWRRSSNITASNLQNSQNNLSVTGVADNKTKKARLRIKAPNEIENEVYPISPYHVGITYVMYKNYPYYLCEETSTGPSYMCTKKNCGVRIFVHGKSGPVDEYKQHDHPPESWIVERNEMYQELKRRVNSEMTPIEEIYQEEAARFPDGAEHLPNVMSSMRTWRQNCRMGDSNLCYGQDNTIETSMEETATDKADLRIKAAGHESEVQLIAPYRIGSTYVMYRDYPYYLRNKKPAGTSYKCSNEHCGASIYVRNSTGAVDEYKQHDHLPESWVIQRNEMYQEVKRRAITEMTPFKVIFQEEAARFPEGAKYLPNLESSMRTWRKKCKMVPSSLWDHQGDSFVKVSSEGQTAVILMSENYERITSCCHTVVVDSSFRALPVVPQVQRMVVMHAIVGDRAYCPIIIMFESESPALYDVAFAKIGLLAGFKPAMNVFVGYDETLNNSLQVLFPGATFREHFYHYAQKVVRLASECGIDFGSPTHRLMVQRLVALALLPRRHLKQGLLHVQHSARGVGEFRVFFSAYRDAWMKRMDIDKVSVYKDPERSSDVINNFHSQLLMRICAVHKSRPPNGWWQFISSVQLVQKSIKPLFKNYECWSESRGVRNELKKLLVTKRITIPEFLQNAGQLLDLEHLFSEPECLKKLNSDNRISNDWSRSQNTVTGATSPDISKSLLAKHGLMGPTPADSCATADIKPEPESCMTSQSDTEAQSHIGDPVSTVTIEVSPTGSVYILNPVTQEIRSDSAPDASKTPVKLIPVVFKPSGTPARRSPRISAKSGTVRSTGSPTVKESPSNLSMETPDSEDICHACVVGIGQELCMVCGRVG